MPIALWKKLNYSKEEFKDELISLYWDQNLSQSKIATKLKCDTSCIEQWFKKLDIKTRTQKQACRNTKRKTFKISKDTEKVFDGLMLSDLHIEPYTFQSRASFGVKHLEFAKGIITHTSEFQWQEPTYNDTSHGWHAKTKFSTNLQTQRERWYPSGIKIVPKDIIITPKLLLWWFLGDGYIVNYGAMLCTDSFTKEDNLFLVELINQKDIPCHLSPNNRIRIKGKLGFKRLISFIGDPPLKCYEYKWGGLLRR